MTSATTRMEGEEPLLVNEVEIAAPPLPNTLALLLRDAMFVELVRNYLVPSQVFRVVRSGLPTRYLKVGTQLRPEWERLQWLQGRLLVPRVEFYAEEGGYCFLLLSEVSGQSADARGDPEGAVKAVARALRAMHTLPVSGCPFHATPDGLLAVAAQAVEDGALERSEFSLQYRHLEPEELLRRAIELRPSTDRLVFTHGDCCLPNIILTPDNAFGMLDLGAAGLSDCWRDLALMANSIRRNFGGEWVSHFLLYYGVRLDEPKMAFFRLVDQLTVMRGRRP